MRGASVSVESGGVYVAGLTRRGVTSAAVTVCSVPSCDQPVCDDRELHCARHATHPTNQLVSRIHSHSQPAALNVAVQAARLTPSTPAVSNCSCSKGPAPYWSNSSYLIFDIRVRWLSVLSARTPECQKMKMAIRPV